MWPAIDARWGFSAAVRCGADERRALERLCRHITRPALANEQVQCNAVGAGRAQAEGSWRDGTMHLVMSPPEFMRHLAALVPRPCRSALDCARDSSCERLLRCDHFSAVSVGEGLISTSRERDLDGGELSLRRIEVVGADHPAHMMELRHS
jgi:hypothetical protein